MRPCDTAEQRVWLGTNQYRCCCGESTSNPNTSHAYSYTCGDSVRCDNTYAYSDRNSNSDGDGDGNCHSYAKYNSDTDGHGHGYSYSYSYHYSISDTYGDTKSHAETSSDSASPTDTVGKGH